MIFSIIILLALAAIVFFHYLQGVFSGTISAICAIIAATLAFSYHETIVESYLGGKFADSAHAMTLIVLFALIYLILRVLLDKMVPGNLRFPAIVDKVGGAAMGLVTGLFACGIVAIGAQYMAFMPDVAGYARYNVLGDRNVIIPATGRQRSSDSYTYSELKSDVSGEFEAREESGLLIPADDVVIAMVSHLSNGGSLAGQRRLESVHPNFLQQLFGQRLGVQTGSNRVALESATQDALQSVDLFRLDKPINQKDFEHTQIRTRKVDAQVRPLPSEILLVVRVIFGPDAADAKDQLVRFSPGAVRLVGQRPAPGGGTVGVNYYPLGTLDGANLLISNKLDDFLFVDVREGEHGADLLFKVQKADVLSGGDKGSEMKDGTFFEFKRLAREDLGGKPVKNTLPPSDKIKVMRKLQPDAPIPTPPPASVPETAPAPAAAAGNLRAKLIGAWAGNTDDGSLLMEFVDDEAGTLKFTAGMRVGQGTWKMVREEGNTLVITRTIGGTAADTNVVFDTDDQITVTAQQQGAKPVVLTRR